MTDKAPIDKALQSREANPRRPLLKKDTRVIDIPVDHHPGTVKGDGPSANMARSAMQSILGSWEKIRDAASDPNVPLERLTRASTGAMEKALQAADDADKRIGEQVSHFEQKIHDATRPKIEPALAQDIRSYWRERGQSGLSAAVVADVRTASAPPYLSGLNDRTFEAINTTAVRAYAPDAAEALEEARAARSKVQDAGARMMGVVAPRLRVWSAPENSNLTALEEYSNV